MTEPEAGPGADIALSVCHSENFLEAMAYAHMMILSPLF